jgi:hypothetical protein
MAGRASAYSVVLACLLGNAFAAHDGKLMRSEGVQSLGPNREESDVKAIDAKADAELPKADAEWRRADKGADADSGSDLVNSDMSFHHRVLGADGRVYAGRTIHTDGSLNDGRFVNDEGGVTDGYDLLTDDGILESCDWRFWMRNSDDSRKNWKEGIKEGQVVCVNGDHQDWKDSPLPKFFKKIMPNIKVPFVLVSTESDGTTPHKNIKGNLNDTKLISWYTWNKGIDHPKLFPLPIGLNNGRMGNLMRHQLAKKTPVPWEKKSDQVLFNFALSMGLQSMRQKLFDMGKNWSFVKYEPYVNGRVELTPEKNDLYDVIQNHKFLACPEGFGTDTHRVWEALYLGVIPIVLKSPISSEYGDELPIVLLDKWADLPKRWEEIKKMGAPKPYSEYSHVKMSHWVKELHKHETRGNGTEVIKK